MTLISCAERASSPVTSLPAWPSFAVPVVVPKVKVGDDLRVVAARRSDAAKKANRIISEAKAWYNNVKSSFEGETK